MARETDVAEALHGAEGLLSFDAPIHSWGDVGKLPSSLIGSTSSRPGSGRCKALLECIEECEERGIRMYGGGQFELGPGRPEIQRLASVFYADGPNDVAPSEYNAGLRAVRPREESAAAA